MTDELPDLDDQPNNPKQEQAGMTGKDIASWICGVIIILLGLGSPYPLILLAWVFMGAILLPPTARFVKERWDFTISKKLKAICIVSVLCPTFLLGLLASSQESSGGSDRGWWEQFYADYYGSY